jgi:predicted enzyme related to lactoylglutathione lyase
VKCRKPIFIHYVHDMARARRFYENTFDVSPSFASGGWTTLSFGSFELALHILSPSEIDEAPLPHAGLNLEVDLIEEMQARVEQGGGIMIELREATRRIPDRVATFRDTEEALNKVYFRHLCVRPRCKKSRIYSIFAIFLRVARLAASLDLPKISSCSVLP